MVLYFDHAALADPFPEVKALGQKMLHRMHANPSSAHQWGQEARSFVDQARFTCADIFAVDPAQVIFTSGATESIHMAIVGGWLARKQAGKVSRKILISPLVHSCVWAAADFLREHFDVEVQTIPLDEEGFFRGEAKVLTEQAWDLIAVEHGSSETGHLQDVATFFDAFPEALKIIDVAASLVSQQVNLTSLGADIMVLSGEKIGGISGAGLLVKQENGVIAPLQKGSQEFGFRGGTENMIGIIALAKALEIHEQKRPELQTRWRTFQEKFRAFFATTFPRITVTTPEKSLAHIFHVIFPDRTGHTFLVQADIKGLCVSSGTACSSGSVEASRALKSLGYSEEEAKRGARFSFGWSTTLKDVDAALQIVKEVLKGGA